MRVARYIATHYNPGTAKRTCAVEIDPDSRLWSQQIRSMSAFRHREGMRAYGDWETARTALLGEFRWTEVQYFAWNDPKYFHELLSHEQVETYDNIWAFYEAIGYDYKKQRYV